MSINSTLMEKFKLYYTLFSIGLTLISFVALYQYFMESMLLFFSFIYPLLIGIIEGTLATKYYIENKLRKVSIYVALYIILLSVFNILYIQFYVEQSPIEILLLVLVFITLVSVVLYSVGTQFSSHFLSFIINKKPPSYVDVSSNTVYYDFGPDDININQIIDLARIVSIKIFDYKYEYKKNIIDENDTYFTVFRRDVPHKLGDEDYLLLYIKKRSKELFFLPLKLRDFVIYKMDTSISGKIKNYMNVFFNKTNSSITANEREDLEFYLSKQTKSKFSISKEWALPIVIFIIIVGLIVIFIFNINAIWNWLSSPEDTMFKAIILIIITAIVSNLGKIMKIFSKIKEFF